MCSLFLILTLNDLKEGKVDAALHHLVKGTADLVLLVTVALAQAFEMIIESGLPDNIKGGASEPEADVDDGFLGLANGRRGKGLAGDEWRSGWTFSGVAKAAQASGERVGVLEESRSQIADGGDVEGGLQYFALAAMHITWTMIWTAYRVNMSVVLMSTLRCRRVWEAGRLTARLFPLFKHFEATPFHQLLPVHRLCECLLQSPTHPRRRAGLHPASS